LKAGNFVRAIEDYNAALKISPRKAGALYGRGLAKLKTGDVAGGKADIAAAKLIKPRITEEFLGYGVK
jgi:Flp pilus assembly protein TadD